MQARKLISQQNRAKERPRLWPGKCASVATIRHSHIHLYYSYIRDLTLLQSKKRTRFRRRGWNCQRGTDWRPAADAFFLPSFPGCNPTTTYIPFLIRVIRISLSVTKRRRETTSHSIGWQQIILFATANLPFFQHQLPWTVSIGPYHCSSTHSM